MVSNPSKEWAQLVSASSPKERLSSFARYCQDLLQWKKGNNKSIRELSYFICSAIKFDDLREDGGASQLIEIACDLETPDGRLTYDKNEEDLFKLMKKLIDNLDNQPLE